MKLEKFSWGDLQQEFKFPSADADVPKAGPSKGSKGSDDVIELDSSETESEEEFSIFGCDAPTISAPSGTGASGGSRSDTSGKGKGKRKGSGMRVSTNITVNPIYNRPRRRRSTRTEQTCQERRSYQICKDQPGTTKHRKWNEGQDGSEQWSNSGRLIG